MTSNAELVLSTLSEKFISIHTFDIEADTLQTIKTNEHIQRLSDAYIGAQEKLNNVMTNISVLDSRDLIREFVDFSTLPDRMKEQKIITCIFEGVVNGWCKASFIRDEQEIPLRHVTFVVERVNEEVLREHEILDQVRKAEKDARQDPLTMLLNRAGMNEEVHAYLKTNPFASGVLMTIDVDDFKLINDVFGHAIGDEALKTVADTLVKHLPKNSIIARNGGDEFQVFVPDASVASVRPLVQKFIKDKPAFVSNDKQYHVTLSIGLAEYPIHSRDFHELCVKADAALYSVKMNRKNGYQVYHTGMEEGNRHQLGFNIGDIVAGIPGSILVYRADKTAQILFANEDMIKLFGCDDLHDFMEFSDGKYSNLIHPLDITWVFESIRDQVASQKAAAGNSKDLHIEDYVDYRIITKDGSIKSVEDVGRLVHNDYYGDIFYVFVRETGGKAEHVKLSGHHYRGLSSNIQIWNGHEANVLSALSRDYTTIFEIDIESRTISAFKLTDDVKRRFGKLVDSTNYDYIIGQYLISGIDESEKNRLQGRMSIEYIKKALSTSYSFTETYLNSQGLYVEMKMIRDDDGQGEPKYVLMGFADRDEETRRDLELQKKHKIRDSLIEGFASEYSATFLLDMETQIVNTVSGTQYAWENFDIRLEPIMSFEDLYLSFINQSVVESDKARLFKACSLENIRKSLARKKAFSTIFQSKYKDRVRFVELKAVKLDEELTAPTRVVIGMSERDIEIGLRFAAESYVENYSSILFCNLVENRSRFYKSDFKDVKEFEEVSYTQTVLNYANYVEPQYKENWQDLSSPSYFQALLSKSDHLELTYKVPDPEKPWRRAFANVVIRNEKKMAETVIISFIKLDDMEAEKLELNERIIEQNAKLEEQQINLEEALLAAEEANNAKTAFLFNMSHDIRTPMNAIIGFRSLLEKHQNDPDKRSYYLKQIDESSSILLSIINNVLEMARIEKGTVDVEETAWSTDQFNDTLFSVFHDMMEKKGIKYTRSVDVEHPYVYCDTIKLREIFINITSNAYKYTNPGGTVHMKVKELPSDRDGWVLFQTKISDTGIGMSEEFLPHLFEEFSREHNSTISKIEGTGLGMPIVKRLVEILDGTIEVESKVGEGTTFIVTLPHRIAEKASLTNVAGVEIDSSIFRGKRILIAEDNDLNYEIASELLTDYGFYVERAADGDICVNMHESAPDGYYDVILMDIQMPHLNGYEASRAIRALDRPEKNNIPILAMTANAFEEDRREAINAGMNGHVSKPINVKVLLKELMQILS